MLRNALLLALLLALAACLEREPPPSSGQAMAFADMVNERDGLDWGPVSSVGGPADLGGRSCWVVDYRRGAAGDRRVVLVDAVSGWAFRPKTLEGLPPPGAGATVSSGTCLLVVRPSGDLTALRGEADRLNQAARGRWPERFSVREARRGPQLVYGWDGDSGMRPCAPLQEWVRTQVPGTDPQWVDLGGR